MKISNVLNGIFGKKESFDSQQYWENRYEKGGNSGRGSYNKLSEFKANVINRIIDEMHIGSAIEFGVGDGNQLGMIRYPRFLGLDVSKKAIQLCIEQYKDDSTKSFFSYDQLAFSDCAGFVKADMSLSLDVIYHLVEQPVYEKYLSNLFNAASKCVVIYSTNEELPQFGGHEKHRVFLNDLDRLSNGWKLQETVENEFSVRKVGEQDGSRANFYIFTRS
jgi:hypothetical protein